MAERRPLPDLRNRSSGLLDAQARCITCGWELIARNAMGVGAIHAMRTGHTVHVESTIVAIYNRTDR